MFQNSRYSVVVNIALFVLGIYFVAAPSTALPTIVTVLSIAAFAYGVWELFMYYRATKNGTDSNRPLMLAIAAVLAGVLLLVFRTQLILGALPIVFALWMVFIAFQRVTQAMTLKETGVIRWYLPLITAVISVILAIVVLTHIMQVNAIITSIIGIYCIALSALTLGEMMTLK